jgi:hypothetical protein
MEYQTMWRNTMPSQAQALETLHRAGYRASPSSLFAGWITVADPARSQRGSEPVRITYDNRQIHPSAVARFIIERE